MKNHQRFPIIEKVKGPQTFQDFKDLCDLSPARHQNVIFQHSLFPF